jgi:hypothetical protein
LDEFNGKTKVQSALEHGRQESCCAKCCTDAVDDLHGQMISGRRSACSTASMTIASRHQYERAPTVVCDLDRLAGCALVKRAELAPEVQNHRNDHDSHPVFERFRMANYDAVEVTLCVLAVHWYLHPDSQMGGYGKQECGLLAPQGLRAGVFAAARAGWRGFPLRLPRKEKALRSA